MWKHTARSTSAHHAGAVFRPLGAASTTVVAVRPKLNSYTREVFTIKIRPFHGIHTGEDMRYFQNFIVFDFEAVLCPQDDDQAGKLKWEAEHQPISVSVCSNVEGFQEPRCFVDPDCESLIHEVLEYMQEIAETSHQIPCEKWEDVSVALREYRKRLLLRCIIATWEREDEHVGRIMHCVSWSELLMAIVSKFPSWDLTPLIMTWI